MKLRMLSVLSIVIALLIKSMDISAQDYNTLRILAHAIPGESPTLLPYPMETELDSIVYRLANGNGVKERYVGLRDSVSAEFEAYERLKLVATEEDLNNLLLHESAIVKVYAHRALMVQQMNINEDYENALRLDSTCVDWLTSDMLKNSTVAELVAQEFFE